MNSETDLRAYQETTMTTQVQAIMCCSWLNILLLTVPVRFTLNYSHANEIATFCMNFLAMIPLAGMLDFATDQVTHYLEKLLGGLLLAIFE